MTGVRARHDRSVVSVAGRIGCAVRKCCYPPLPSQESLRARVRVNRIRRPELVAICDLLLGESVDISQCTEKLMAVKTPDLFSKM